MPALVFLDILEELVFGHLGKAGVHAPSSLYTQVRHSPMKNRKIGPEVIIMKTPKYGCFSYHLLSRGTLANKTAAKPNHTKKKMVC